MSNRSNSAKTALLFCVSFFSSHNIVVHNEDDTLGNLIQTYFTKLYSDIQNKDRILNFVGYVRPHPLLHKINITFQPKIEMKWDAIMDNIITPGCASVIKSLNKILKEL